MHICTVRRVLMMTIMGSLYRYILCRGFWSMSYIKKIMLPSKMVNVPTWGISSYDMQRTLINFVLSGRQIHAFHAVLCFPLDRV